MKGTRVSSGDNKLRILKEEFNVDLTQSGSLKAFEGASLETLKRIRELDREILNSLYPNR
jgi:hypothetical protein